MLSVDDKMMANVADGVLVGYLCRILIGNFFIEIYIGVFQQVHP